MKRTLSLVLALVMVLGTFTGVFAAETATVDAGKFLEKVGVLEGDDNGNLMLDKTLLRRDMVVLVSRLMDAEEVAAEFPAEGVLTFEDITDAYYNGFIAWSVANKIIEGHDAKTFGFNENVTAQQFATVLLRVMGKEVKDADYPKVLETAKALGLLADVTVENATEITRAQMAAMTLNALKAENGKLAKELDIELPEAPKATELEAKVYSENLKEVIVELNNAELVNKEDLLNKENYKVARNYVERVTLDGNNVLVELRDKLIKNQSYELVIGGIDKALNKRHSFKAYDDMAPVVEKVEVLGEYGIKITASEPVQYNGRERSFSIDGKNIAMKVEEYGRVIILTPYYAASFPEDAKELTIVGLEDYANFKSSVQKFDIEVSKDEVAPTVTGIELINDYTIEVTFDKDVYKNSVKAYESRKQLGNVSYGEGRHTVYSRPEVTQTERDNNAYANKFETNKVRYVFEERLPRNVDITVEGVQNHSKVAMEAVTERAVVSLDRRQPQILDVEYDQLSNSEAKFTLYFDRDVEFGAAADHIAVYNGSVAKKDLVTDAKINKLAYQDDKAANLTETKNIVVLEIGNLKLNEKANDYAYDYILEIKNFYSESFSATNRMHVDYYDFELKPGTAAFTAVGVRVDYNNPALYANAEVTISFSKAVNRAIAEDATNYIFTKGTSKKDVAQFKGSIEVHDNGRKVTLIIPAKAYADFAAEELIILETLKDIDGKRLPRSVWNFELADFVGNVAESKDNLEALLTRARNLSTPITVGNAYYDAAKAVLDNSKATSAQVNAAILEFEAYLRGNGSMGEIVRNVIAAKVTEVTTDAVKKAKLENSLEKLANEGFETLNDFLDKVAQVILDEFKGVDALAKSVVGGEAKTTINGVEVIVKATLDSNGVINYTIEVTGATSITGTLNKVEVKLNAYELKFTSNIADNKGVNVVVYDSVNNKVSATSTLTYKLPVGTYTYVATAEGYNTQTATIELKDKREVKLYLVKTITE